MAVSAAMKTVALFVGLVFAVGCSSSNGDIAKLRDAKDRICSCKDMECSLAASKDLRDVSNSLKEKVADLSADERAEAAKIAREVADCIQNGRR
jgi:hypothetical protein